MRYFAGAGITFVFCVFAALAVPAALRDDLFYRSDIYSMSLVLSVAALTLFAPAALVGLGLSRLPTKTAALVGRAAAYVAAIGIIDIFLALALLYLVGVLNWAWLTKLVKHPIIAIAVCALPAAAIVYLHKDKAGMIARVKHVGCLALVAAPILVAYALTSARISTVAKASRPNDGRHLALVILDGWPSQHLHSYNPDAPPNAFDKVLEKAAVFLGAYTSAGWTSAYFGTFHNGNPRVVAGEKRKRPPTASLGAHLQKLGVGTRFMNFHRNGIPEGSNAHRTDHKGLRSYFLTENFAWFPRLFGLEYHLCLSGPAMTQNLKPPFANRLFALANPAAAHDRRNILTELLMPELRNLRDRHRNSFTLFHASWNELGNHPEFEKLVLPGAQKIENEKSGSFPAEKIRANDYRYGPDLEPVVASRRKTTRSLAHRQGAYLEEFFSALHADPVLKNTVVVLTADHGSIYGKGRVWYGFHPNREVVRVPFFVIGSNSQGRHSQLFSTPAVTKAVSEFYTSEARGEFMPAGVNNGPVFSLTLNSDVQKEWFLVATYPRKAYWMNLHPKGPGETMHIRIDGYRETVVERSTGIPSQLAATRQDLLKLFGIKPDEVHPSFR